VLLAASITIVGDLITVLYRFLQGETSPRFFLKALTVLVIAGAVFGFYFLERKKIQYKQDIPRSTFQLFGGVLAGFVVIGIMLGFVVAGSPSTERNRTFDAQRASHLSQLASCINDYAAQYHQLPESIDVLGKTSYSYCAESRDPETDEPYVYEVTKPMSTSKTGLIQGEFKLCATFALPAGDDDTTRPMGYYSTDKWNIHGSGYECDVESVSVSVTAADPAYNYYY
jgi:hypothetical protein